MQKYIEALEQEVAALRKLMTWHPIKGDPDYDGKLIVVRDEWGEVEIIENHIKGWMRLDMEHPSEWCYLPDWNNYVPAAVVDGDHPFYPAPVAN